MTLFIIKEITHSLITGMMLAASITITCMLILKAEKFIKKRRERRIAIQYNESDTFRFIGSSQSKFNNFRKKKLR